MGDAPADAGCRDAGMRDAGRMRNKILHLLKLHFFFIAFTLTFSVKRWQFAL